MRMQWRDKLRIWHDFVYEKDSGQLKRKYLEAFSDNAIAVNLVRAEYIEFEKTFAALCRNDLNLLSYETKTNDELAAIIQEAKSKTQHVNAQWAQWAQGAQ